MSDKSDRDNHANQLMKTTMRTGSRVAMTSARKTGKTVPTRINETPRGVPLAAVMESIID